MAAKRQIFAMGGFSWRDQREPLEEYMISLANTRCPAVCFVGTAKGDNTGWVEGFYMHYARLYPECKVTHLPLFGQKGDMAEIIKRNDIFFIGGGSTTNMLLLWRAWGLDDLLRTAYEGGKIMAGASAGANCWFEQYIDDCSGHMACYPGLGWLEGTFAPHYDEADEDWRKQLLKSVKSGVPQGLGCDNNVGIHYINEQRHALLANRAGAFAYDVSLKDGKLVEKKMKPERIK